VEPSSSSSDAGIAAAAASASRARVSHSSTVADSVTGVLLVGGASSRFGAPKALARLGAETLAARGWRALAWCDERFAVGKSGDALPLPFPVRDDGSGGRAPIFGVVAGLRAARNEVCVVLPVDCPLMTEEALRILAEERAVVQTGPLPGAYDRTVLPELERRIAVGELSLRGANPRVVEVDPQLLEDVDTPEDLRRLEGRAGSKRPA
jgi:molybdenum cofactor guanylyltransferase